MGTANDSLVDVPPRRGFRRHPELATYGAIREPHQLRVTITSARDTVLDRSITRSGDNPLTLTIWLAASRSGSVSTAACAASLRPGSSRSDD